jgi:hypothetical protein
MTTPEATPMMAALFVNANAGCGHVAAVGDADRAVGTIAQRKNADLRGFDVSPELSTAIGL